MRFDKRVRPETGSLFMANDRWICLSAQCNHVDEDTGSEGVMPPGRSGRVELDPI